MSGNIEVRLHVKDMPMHVGQAEYFEWIERELQKSGVAFSYGQPENGVLYRRDDPEDFGCTIWTYVPNTNPATK